MRDIAIEKAARKALNSCLAKSIEERAEYGGMIYQKEKTFGATEPRTQGFGNTVNVGQWELNRGCPEGSMPVAYYHTHPNFRAGGMEMKYNEFSEEDKTLAKDLNLDAYLGTLDGSFFLYEPKHDRVTKFVKRLRNTSK